jgi:hypothetical protein
VRRPAAIRVTAPRRNSAGSEIVLRLERVVYSTEQTNIVRTVVAAEGERKSVMVFEPGLRRAPSPLSVAVTASPALPFAHDTLHGSGYMA